MAVLPAVPYVRVRVVISGSKTVEYDDPDDIQDGITEGSPKNRTSVYIESKTNQRFGFEYWVNSKKRDKAIDPGTCLGFYATIDGRGCSSVVICNEDGFKAGQWAHQLNGDRIRTKSSLKLMPFIFAEVKPGDDSTYAPPKVALQLGELVVQVWRVRKCNPVPAPVEKASSTKKINVHESQLKGKAVSHATQFGAPQTSSDQETFYKLEYIDPVSTPLAEFHFKYRSRDILEQIMISSPAHPRVLSQNLDLAPLVTNSLPRIPVPRPIDKRPFAKGKDVIKIFEALTGQKNKSPAEMATPSTANTNSVITGKMFNQVAGAFLPHAFGQIAPKVITSTVTSISEPVPAVATNVQEEIRYPITPAFGSISSLAPGFVSKSAPAMPLETPAKVICRPDIEVSASDELRAASATPLAPATPATRVAQTALEPAVTPFTRVLMEIQKNLSDLRDIAKGFNVVNVVEDLDPTHIAGSTLRCLLACLLTIPAKDERLVASANHGIQNEISRFGNEIRTEVEGQAKPEQAKPEENLKRELAVDQDEDIEIVLERPVKRRHIFTAEDEIIDLTV
ncbi:af46eb43-1fb3-4f29-abe8-68e04dc8b36e [Sclerotinia trifoliorum]|uniref:Af46eb43-1fb3-4f29-abe8-68e04dc8b36e n=1 Tax=Sclerotinia trifoliorum TaxID=28548 RepID=A0A8H2W4W9_9HELO|nr:af46eb43-1fb3-4f29-abe8-68e04dc8b36e [Sclerotinia trifoliorum]